MTIRLSEDKELVQEIREKLIENSGYCPCRIEKTEDTKCMCKEFREQESGECHCGLFIKDKEWFYTKENWLYRFWEWIYTCFRIVRRRNSNRKK